MSTYLQELTLRLATGAAALDESLRKLHGDFFLAAQREDGGFAGREGASDLYYTSFALRGLAILGLLHGNTAARAATFLQSKLAGQTSIIDFCSLIYSAALLETSAGIDVFAQAPASWKPAVLQALEEFRRPDGGYAKTREGQSSSTYQSFLVVLCQQILGHEPSEPDRLTRFVLSRQREDGGFVEVAPMKRSGTNPTAAAIGLLRILSALSQQVQEQVIDFVFALFTSEGGIAANTLIPFADNLSTFTGLVTLLDLDRGNSELDLPRIRQFILGLALEQGGFRAGPWDHVPDVEYTFYGLGTLALLAWREMQAQNLDPLNR